MTNNKRVLILGGSAIAAAAVNALAKESEL
jgi:hypothetical protein